MGARILALVVKELLALLRDRASRVVLVVPPILQLMVFGYAASFDLNHIPYAVYDQDGGMASRQLLARFEGSSIFHRIAIVHHEGEVAPLIDGKHALMVLHVGPHFTRNLLRRQSAHLQVVIDGRDSNTATLALNDVNGVVMAFNREWVADHAWRGPPADLVVRAWFNPNLRSRWFIVPGIVALLTLVITLLVTGLSVAREREMGTFEQLLVTPLTPPEILLGKALPGFIIGGLEGAFIALMAVVWFHVPFVGSVAALALGMFFFLLAAIGIGLLISSLAVTQQQGLLGVFLFMVPSVILSGFATPIANMPALVRWLTLANPMRYFLVIVRGVFLRGSGVMSLWPEYGSLALIGLVGMSIAAWMFRHRMH